MRRMRILSLISGLETEDGGPVRFCLDLNEALVGLGHDAQIATVGRPSGSVSTHQQQRVTWHEPSRPLSLYASKSLRVSLAKRIPTFDLIHVDGLYRAQSRYVRVATGLSRVPYVSMPHGNLESYQTQQSRVPKAVFDLIEGRRFLENAAGLLFTDSSELEFSRPRIPRHVPTFVLPVGVTVYTPTPVATAKFVSPLPGRDHTFLFLGRLARKKQPDLLIQAWACVKRDPSDRLIIAGPEGDFSAHQLKELCQKIGVARSVEVIGQVTRHEAAWLYQRSHVFILPSQHENFGMTVSEAMLAGCSVATTSKTASSKLVRSSGGGWVGDGDSAQSITELLTTVIANRRKATGYGLSGKRVAERDLSWTNVVHKYADVYREVISSSGRRFT